MWGFVCCVAFYTLSVATIVSWYRAMIMEPGRVPRGWVRCLCLALIFSSVGFSRILGGCSARQHWQTIARRKSCRKLRRSRRRLRRRRFRFGAVAEVFLFAHHGLCRRSAHWRSLNFDGASSARSSSRCVAGSRSNVSSPDVRTFLRIERIIVGIAIGVC